MYKFDTYNYLFFSLQANLKFSKTSSISRKLLYFYFHKVSFDFYGLPLYTLKMHAFHLYILIIYFLTSPFHFPLLLYFHFYGHHFPFLGHALPTNFETAVSFQLRIWPRFSENTIPHPLIVWLVVSLPKHNYRITRWA